MMNAYIEFELNTNDESEEGYSMLASIQDFYMTKGYFIIFL